MKKLYIIGCPRSGTTWTGLLLARHPAVVACMETSVMRMLHQFAQWSASGEKREDSRWLESVALFDDDSGATAHGIGGPLRFVGLFEPEDLQDFCRATANQAYARALARKPGASVLVDKTPRNLAYGEFIVRLFPDAYVLHVIRDPRSVVLSLRHGAEDIAGIWPRDPAGGAQLWRKNFLRAREVAQFTNRYREIRYEALLEHPADEVGRLLDWLELPSDPAWCEAVVEASSMKEMKKGMKATPPNFFRKGIAASWREEITDGDLRIIEYINRDVMEELGYAPAVRPSRGAPLPLRVADARRRLAGLVRAAAGHVRGLLRTGSEP